MTDAEISRRLALAIGYSPISVMCHNSYCAVKHETGPKNSGWHWYEFDYRDPAVIFPIAERFGCFPTLRPSGHWRAHCYGGDYVFCETATAAIAIAVISAKEQA